MPGSHFAKWTKQRIEAKNIKCTEVIQEDYGWGFWVDMDGCAIWMGFAGIGNGASKSATWHVMVDHEPGFKIAQWFKRKRGRESAIQLGSMTEQIIRSELPCKIK